MQETKNNQDSDLLLDRIVNLENEMEEMRSRVSEYDCVIQYIHSCIVRRIDLKNEFRVMINCDWKKVEDALGGPVHSEC